MIEETLVTMVERFNRHVQQNPGLQHELHDVTRTLDLCLTNGESYRLRLKEGRLTLPAPANGKKADITITTDTETFEGLIRKDIGPMKAIFSRKLVIEATLEDKLLLRRLL